jgi:hypothetical protein
MVLHAWQKQAQRASGHQHEALRRASRLRWDQSSPRDSARCSSRSRTLARRRGAGSADGRSPAIRTYSRRIGARCSECASTRRTGRGRNDEGDQPVRTALAGRPGSPPTLRQRHSVDPRSWRPNSAQDGTQSGSVGRKRTPATSVDPSRRRTDTIRPGSERISPAAKTTTRRGTGGACAQEKARPPSEMFRTRADFVHIPALTHYSTGGKKFRDIT